MKLKSLFLIILLIIAAATKGQDITFFANEKNSYVFTPQNLGTSTPQVTDMIRYGNIQVNKYHGLLDFGVTLKGYADTDFNIPVSLKYISSGFTPAKRPSYVGYNWIINCGGVVTRKLNGSPDDTKGCYRNSVKEDYLLDGLLVAHRANLFVNYPESRLKSFDVDKNTEGNGTPYQSDFKYEFEPDIFTFAFGNYYGSFIIGNDGMPVLLGASNCKIDISGMAIQPYSTTATPISSSIRITTPDGYIYTFGGASDYLEYFIPNNPEKCKVMQRYITSWFLKQIKAPNGRVANFNYHTVSQFNKYRAIAYTKVDVLYTYTACSITNPDHNKSDEKPIVADKIYTPVLDSINIDKATVLFSYDDYATLFYSDETSDKSLQIKTIKTKYNKATVDSASFTYTSSDRYFFLESISQNGQKYQFDYNLSVQLPDPLTISVDHWGFWNGGYEIVPSGLINYCLGLTTNRASNSTSFNVGLLNKITYPTGGVSKITYEPNKYSVYFSRDTGNITTQSSSFCGGARVLEIADYESAASSTAINSRHFYYQSEDMKVTNPKTSLPW